jgi:hypothetical protein
MTIVEPGGARTEFRYGSSAQVAELMPIYDQTPAHSFLRMLDPKNGLAPGDPARMAARIIESVDVSPAPPPQTSHPESDLSMTLCAAQSEAIAMGETF